MLIHRIKIIVSVFFLLLAAQSFSEEKKALKIRLLNQWPGASINNFRILTDIIAEKYNIVEVTDEDYDLVIDGVFDNKKINNQNAFKIFFTGEAIPAKLDGYDLSLGFEYLENQSNYIRLPLYYIYYNEKIDTNYNRKKCKTDHKNFACFLVSNGKDKSFYDGVDSRDHLFFRLSLYKPVLSGGNHLNNIGAIVPINKTMEWLSQCKFTIAYESRTSPGYITEKVFQAYFAGSIPIYYSDVEAQKDVNSNAIISAQSFTTEEELIQYIISIDKDDDKYCKIWNAKLIMNEDQNYKNMQNKIRKKLETIYNR
jgi:alpha(1,3/1,4) fucosyltransferase